MELCIASKSLLADSSRFSSPPHRSHRNPLGLYILLCTTLVLPFLAQAVQIGDVVTVSKLGESLRVEVAIVTATNEPFDASCLSLVAPDPATEDATHYLTENNTKTSTQNAAGKTSVVLSTHKTFNDVFAKFKLQVKCSGSGSIAKTFTVLPDIDNYAPPPEPSTPPVQAITLTPQPVPNTAPPTNSVSQPSVVIVSPSSETPKVVSTSSPRSHVKQTSVVNHLPRIAHHSNNSGIFQLKISGDPLDASRIGKISDEERAILLARQKMLDSDDQMASILALQNQVQQLQNDIGDLRAKVAQLDSSPAHINQNSLATPNEVAVTEAAASASAVPVARAITPPVAIPALHVPKKSNWYNWGLQLGLLLIAIAGAVWGFSRYAKTKSARTQSLSQTQKIKILPTTTPLPTSQSAPSANANQTSIAPTGEKPSRTVGETTGSFIKMQALTDTPVSVQAEEDGIVEEAQLYAAHNHPLRAVKILQELLAGNPKKSEAWLLLLAILASRSLTNEFENNARAYLRHNPDDSESWQTIQILGRTIDSNNPLYKDNRSTLSPKTVLGDRHLIGDVLIDLNMILPETLHQCLANFNPKEHGRFGAYLVTQKVITHQQLTQALIHQNTLNQGVSYMESESIEVLKSAEMVKSPATIDFELPG